MPELPEVENLARGLRERLLGSTIEEIRCHFQAIVDPDPDCLAEAVRSLRLEKLHRHGKYIFFLFQAGVTLALHLRMTGQLLLVPKDRVPDKHTHLELLLKDEDAKIVFRDVRKFGRLKVLEGGVEQFIAAHRLGADALSISTGQLHRVLRQTSRTIKAALLDQAVIAGLGNIYTDEILFREGISPIRKASSLDLDQVAHLRRTMRAVLRSAIRGKGTTISDYVDERGREGSYQNRLLVYAHAGEPCPRCATPIRKSQVAGRGTYSCPSCQRA